MRLSCLPGSFFADLVTRRMSVAEWARLGAELGLDAIDLSILFVPDRSHMAVMSLRRAIEGEGMRVGMVTAYPDFTHPDPSVRARELTEAREVVEVAASLGADLVRVTAGQAHPGTPRQDGVTWAAEGLTRLVECSRNLPVWLVFENHAKSSTWHYADFSQASDVFLEIVRATEGTGLGINFDTGNATAFADEPVELLKQVLPRVMSVHAADTSRRGEVRHVLLGTGITPFVGLFRELKRTGWDGWICMKEASCQGRAGIEAAARFVRQAWDGAGNYL